MKLIAVQNMDGQIFLVKPDTDGWSGRVLGEVELDVKPVKKWVKKEVVATGFMNDSYGHWVAADIPYGARDVKVSYEVEE